MAPGMDLRELLEARKGLPTESQAARKIATFAVIPATMVGLLASTQLVGIADPPERLLWVCTASALASGFSSAFLVVGVYHLFGFRPVALLADALVGVFYGFLGGATVSLSLLTFQDVPLGWAMSPLLLIPLGAVTVPLVRAWRDRARGRATFERAMESRTAEPSGEGAPPRTRDFEA